MIDRMPADTLRINEVFFSIQGESSWAGCPCVFVRLTGCHLRCSYCDTEYAFKEGTSRRIDSILEEVCSQPTDLVQITGGEPLLQRRVLMLITALCDQGKTVLIETSGSCDISVCDPRAIRIMDIKTPGSGEHERNLWENVEHLTDRDEVKFVICDEADYLWAKRVIEQYDLADRCRAVLMSPVFEQSPGLEIAGQAGLHPRELAEWMLHDPPRRADSSAIPIRMQTQLHKHIWDPQMRGV
jgi:7-carboxy-7-deazaguanine synthase